MLHLPAGSLAEPLHVSASYVPRLLRAIPFVRLAHSFGGGSRGRPRRSLEFDAGWRFSQAAGRRPLTVLLQLLRNLHRLGEPFALGVPFTSAYLSPFLYPEVRVYAPAETLSAWRVFLGGTHEALSVKVDLLPEGWRRTEVEGLPMLAPAPAVVDALDTYAHLGTVDLLGLADGLLHLRAVPREARDLAARCGLEQDVRVLAGHLDRKGRTLRRGDATVAHERYGEFRNMPAATFSELATSTETYR